MENPEKNNPKNDHYQTGYEKLKAALRAYDEEKTADFFAKKDDAKPIAISEEGKENMRALFTEWMGEEMANRVIEKEEEHYRQRVAQWEARRRRRMQKRVAAVCIAVFLVAGVSTAAVAFDIPGSIYRSYNKETYTKVNVDSLEDSADKHDYIEQEYVLSECIDGYELVDKYILDDIIYFVYQNGDEKAYTFSQRTEQFNINLNTENSPLEMIDTMYGQAAYYDNEGLKALAWAYKGYYFKIEGTLTLEELKFLQESLTKGESINEK